jgi:hypothetical protein
MTKGKRTPIIDGYKYCQKCQCTKPLSEFYAAKTKYGVRSPCKQCNRAESKARYEQEGSIGKTNNAIRQEARLELKRKLVAAAGGCCTRCGYNKSIYALDFHHPGKDKENTVSNLLTLAVGKKSEHMALALAEAAKCILLCANCHREVHAE